MTGRNAGVVSDRRWEAFLSTRDSIRHGMELLEGLVLSPQVCIFSTLPDTVLTRPTGMGSCWVSNSLYWNPSQVRGFIFALYSRVIPTLCSAFEMLRYPNIRSTDLQGLVPGLSEIDPAILARIDIDGEHDIDSSAARFRTFIGRYAQQLFRQEADLKDFMHDESLQLDPYMDYTTVDGLSSEVRERLAKVRPTTIVGHSALDLCIS